MSQPSWASTAGNPRMSLKKARALSASSAKMMAWVPVIIPTACHCRVLAAVAPDLASPAYTPSHRPTGACPTG